MTPPHAGDSTGVEYPAGDDDHAGGNYSTGGNNNAGDNDPQEVTLQEATTMQEQ